MTQSEIAQLLVGVARAQAAALEAVATSLESPATPSPIKMAVQSRLHAMLGGSRRPAVTLETLPAKLLQAALAPMSPGGKAIDTTAETELARLLKG